MSQTAAAGEAVSPTASVTKQLRQTKLSADDDVTFEDISRAKVRRSGGQRDGKERTAVRPGGKMWQNQHCGGHERGEEAQSERVTEGKRKKEGRSSSPVCCSDHVVFLRAGSLPPSSLSAFRLERRCKHREQKKEKGPARRRSRPVA